MNDEVTLTPIEERFLAALLLCLRSMMPKHTLEYTDRLAVFQSPTADLPTFMVVPQAKVGPYRADFGLMVSLGQEQQTMAVECDGHDFHEKTKKQAAHDKKRDRFFAAHGLTVLRFAGSEIHANAIECARSALGIMSTQRTGRLP